MTVSAGDRTIKATPGTMVVVPRYTPHPFVIESEPLRGLILLTPAGTGGWFKEFSVAAPAMTFAATGGNPYSKIQKMLAAAPKFGIEFVLPKKSTRNLP
jgi:hypothetical protein